MKNVSTNSLIEAMEARRDGVCFRVVHSVSDIGLENFRGVNFFYIGIVGVNF
jgi:hypothetical protein